MRTLLVLVLLGMAACTKAENKPAVEHSRYHFLECFVNGDSSYTTFRDKTTGHDYLYIDGHYSGCVVALEPRGEGE